MGGFFTAIVQFLKPIIIVSTGAIGVLAVVVAAVANPSGAVNQFICTIIDSISGVLPSTPVAYKISNLIASAMGGSNNPFAFVVYEIIDSMRIIFGVAVTIKVYKLIPFKAT